ncbi:hypothetical protein LRS06_00955 [Hymenobacter sp. J193]|uniref:hypothetical protein n=1 Tax=Hymenobacter sp. J193 TaxID=2898429 RepID=UPI0021518D39|nr:hypothetical protein [Hymenobacter sp. J193]MCR5886362.1 hypothetical protein [Hymenobacter sp. J193]
MKVLLALGLNSLLFLWLGRWLWQQRRDAAIGAWLGPALAFKLLATVASVVMLSYDAALYQQWGSWLNEHAWHETADWLRLLGQDSLHLGERTLFTRGLSNTLFFIKLLSLLNFASAGIVWLNALYVSLFSFIGSWQLVRVLARRFPATPPSAAAVAFLVWPSVVFWTSGLTKEALLVGAAAWLVALVIDASYQTARPLRIGQVLGMILLAFLVVKMRYFFAVFLLLALAVLVLIWVGQRRGLLQRRWLQVGLLVLILGVGALVAGRVSHVFTGAKFSKELMRNYNSLLKRSAGRPHIEYPGLEPTVPSVSRYAPLAVGNALMRPYLTESVSLRYFLAALENIVLLVVLGTGAWAIVRGRGGQLPFALVLVLLFYCLVVAVLIGLTTPNLGTLNRYRVSFLPFLLLLLLQNEYVARWLRRLPWSGK